MAKYLAGDIQSTLIKKFLGTANSNRTLAANQEFNVSAYPFIISSQIASQTIPVNVTVPSYSSSPSSFSNGTTVPLVYAGEIHGSMPKKYNWTSYPHLVYYSQIVLKYMSTNTGNTKAFSHASTIPTTVLNNVIPPYLPTDGQSTYAITVEYWNGAWNTLVSNYYLFDRDVGVLTIYGSDSTVDYVTELNPPRISYWRYEGTFGLAGAGSTGSTGANGSNGATGATGATGLDGLNGTTSLQSGIIIPTTNSGLVSFNPAYESPPVVTLCGNSGISESLNKPTIIPLGLAGVSASGFNWIAGATGLLEIHWIAVESLSYGGGGGGLPGDSVIIAP